MVVASAQSNALRNKAQKSHQAFSALDVEDHTILKIVWRYLELK